VSVADNLKRVRERIAAAARRVGREPQSAALMAVSKTFPAEAIRQAYAAGQRLFGENYVQEFAAKREALRDLADAKFHLIGHLQSNKAAKAAEVFSAVDSIDSLKLAQRLNAALAGRNDRLPVLLEINVGGEESKTGIPLDSPELPAILEAAPELNHLEIRGLMVIPPMTGDPAAARPFFRAVRDLRDRIAGQRTPGVRMEVLSMGMSHDFEVAIEEGSTCVRIGTAIFGARPPK
jgi:pyridoxal phosphate enzyme (YggS family)